MRILSGDLAPPRKGRRRGYGRKRSKAPLVLLVVLLLAGAAVLGALQLRGDDEPAAEVLAAEPLAPPVCPTPTTAPPVAAPVVLPAPGEVRLTLFNGTTTNGLGRTVGDELAARGFAVAGTGNAPTPLVGPSQVNHGPGAEAAAQLVAAQVDGAQVVAAPAAEAGSVSLVIGTEYARLRTAEEVATVVAALQAPPPAPAPAPVPEGCA